MRSNNQSPIDYEDLEFEDEEDDDIEEKKEDDFVL